MRLLEGWQNSSERIFHSFKVAPMSIPSVARHRKGSWLVTDQTPSPKTNEPWYQDVQNRKHLYDERGNIVALAMTEQAAGRIVAAINAVQKLSTEALTAGVIDEALEHLLALYDLRTKRARDAPFAPGL